MYMNKTLGILVAIAVIGGGMYWYSKNSSVAPVSNETVSTEPSSAMRAEENMIVIMEQRPGNTVTASQIHLAATGFVVIHEDTNGAPGAIIGSSSLLQAGDSSQVAITLSRSTKDGEKLHAMLHSDSDGNGTFSATADQPVQSRLGGPIEGWFDISTQASENTPITI